MNVINRKLCDLLKIFNGIGDEFIGDLIEDSCVNTEEWLNQWIDRGLRVNFPNIDIRHFKELTNDILGDPLHFIVGSELCKKIITLYIIDEVFDYIINEINESSDVIAIINDIKNAYKDEYLTLNAIDIGYKNYCDFKEKSKFLYSDEKVLLKALQLKINMDINRYLVKFRKIREV